MTDTQPDEIIRMQICVSDENKIEVLRVSESISNGLFKFILDNTIIGKFGLVNKPSDLKDKPGNINCDVMFLKNLESKVVSDLSGTLMNDVDTDYVMMYGIKSEILQSDREKHYSEFKFITSLSDTEDGYYVDSSSKDYEYIREIIDDKGENYLTDRARMTRDAAYLKYKNGRWTMVLHPYQADDPGEIKEAINKLFETIPIPAAASDTPAAAPDTTTTTTTAAPDTTTTTTTAAPDIQPSLTGGDDRTFTRKNNVVRRKMTFKRTN